MKSSIGMAESVSYRPVPREPISTDTRAIVASSGASMTLMKSKRPSVDHCCLTEAPSCSISLLTSRMRDGLFLTVWTPSGVRVVSMMYVGMGWESARVGVRPTPDADAASGLRSEEQRDELRQAALPPGGVARRRRVVGEAAVHERQLGRVAGR